MHRSSKIQLRIINYTKKRNIPGFKLPIQLFFTKKRLFASQNPFTEPDVSPLTKMTFLQVGETPMKDLNVSKNRALELLDLHESPNMKNIYVWQGFDQSILPFPPQGSQLVVL